MTETQLNDIRRNPVVEQDDDLNEVNEIQYLTFFISDSLYGAEVDAIKEIIEYCRIIRVPLAPKCLKGVINLRGKVVPVIDIAIRFGKEQKPINKKSCVVILELSHANENIEIGFVVDEVKNLIDVTSTQLMRAPEFGTNIRTEFIVGMYRLSDKTNTLITFLNLDRVLSIDELTELVLRESSAV